VNVRLGTADGAARFEEARSGAPVAVARARWSARIVLALAAFTVLAGQWQPELVTVDDLREAEIAREIYAGGDLVIPRLAGLPFVEKPPAFPATVAAAYALAGGPSVVAARLVVAGFALLALGAVYLAGRLALGEAGGALAAALLAFAPRFQFTAHQILLDNALTASLAVALGLWWAARTAGTPGRQRRICTALMFCLGVSFLVKGFVGPALFGAAFGAHALLTRRLELRPLLRPAALAAFLAPALLWLVPFVLRAPPDQLREFFIENHVGRALEAYRSQARPFAFYLKTLSYAFLPGSLLLPFAAFSAWRGRRGPGDDAGTFFLAASVGPLLLLSAARAKAMVYLTPVYPAFSLLAAWWCVEVFREARPARQAIRIALALCAVAGAGIAIGLSLRSAAALGPEGVSSWRALGLFSGAGLAGAVVLAVELWRGSLERSGLAAAFLASLAWVLVHSGPLAAAKRAEAGWRSPLAGAMAAAGDRELLLYRPDDEMRGACGFYRRRTAPEVLGAEDLLARLREPPPALALLKLDRGRLPRRIRSAAAAAGADLEVELRLPYYRRELALVRVGPGEGAE
jgi:4-amino-4-deoxy-L-arabinose transferase-like glycosyltransferase